MYKTALSKDGLVTDRAQSGKAICKYIGWLEVGRYSDNNFHGNSVMRLLIIIKHASFKESEDSEFRGTDFQIEYVHLSHLS